jgi:hypothetical protein
LETPANIKTRGNGDNEYSPSKMPHLYLSRKSLLGGGEGVFKRLTK